MSALVRAGGETPLTEKQGKLVKAILSGLSNQEAYEAAGYAENNGATTAILSPAVQAALREGRAAVIAGELTNKAMKAIDDLLGPKTPAATRAGVAKWVLEQGAASGDEDNIPLHQMTPEQLDRFMARAQKTIDEGGPAPIIDVTPKR